jgi:hypothetical protein
MKKLMTIFGAMFIFSAIMTSCGDNKSKESNEVKKESTSTSSEVNSTVKAEGPLGTVNYSEFKIGNKDKAYFKMVDNGSTEIKLGEYNFINVTAEFEIVKTFTGKLGKYTTEQAFVSLVALDKDGNTIKLSSTTNGEMRPQGDGEGAQFADFLRGEPGSKAKFTFTGSISKEGTFDADKEKTKEAAKNIAGFKVLTDK